MVHVACSESHRHRDESTPLVADAHGADRGAGTHHDRLVPDFRLASGIDLRMLVMASPTVCGVGRASTLGALLVESTAGLVALQLLCNWDPLHGLERG